MTIWIKIPIDRIKNGKDMNSVDIDVALIDLIPKWVIIIITAIDVTISAFLRQTEPIPFPRISPAASYRDAIFLAWSSYKFFYIFPNVSVPISTPFANIPPKDPIINADDIVPRAKLRRQWTICLCFVKIQALRWHFL